MRSLLKKYSQVFIPGSMGINAPAVFKKRQVKLLKSLDAPAIFSGVPENLSKPYSWISTGEKTFQDPALLYLCGINQPKITLLFNPLAAKTSDKIVLFVPEKDKEAQYWDGVFLGIDKENSSSKNEITKLTGIKNIYLNSEFDKYLKTVLISLKKDHIYHYFYDFGSKTQKKSEFSWHIAQDLKRRLKQINSLAKSKIELKSIASKHLENRVIVDEFHLKDFKKAIKITNDSFITMLSELKSLRTEREVAALIEYGINKETAQGLSFSTICASSKNACVLHYIKNDEIIKKGSLVLLDFGARFANAFADVSRTVPANGKFNPLQAILYNIVLTVQKNNEKRVKAGVRISDLNRQTWLEMAQLLEERFYAIGGKANLALNPRANLERDGFLAPHGVSHLIGWQVHEGDPFGLYKNQKLKPGMVISNEPGLYGYFELKVGKKTYKEDIGIRIEDDLFVTKDACVNLTKKIPKEITTIEALM